ncbi:MAG: ABC transporter substrate-binding protein [Desulfomonile sp.]|nr:ABC transporter substrate-binding protein [Desulfomonile sp.]
MKKMLLWTIVMALVIAVCAAGAVTAADAPGVSDTEIRIGQWAALTGPAAAWGAVARGAEAYFKMINDEGGIHGRMIKHLVFDDQYNPARTVAGIKELVEGPGVFAFVAGDCTACALAARDYLVEKKIIWMALGNAWSIKPDRHFFFIYPNYLDEAAILVKYAVETMGKKKIAFFYQNDDYGKGGLKGAQQQLEKYKLKLAAEVPVEPQDRDLKSHTMAIKNADPDVVILWVNPTSAVIMRKTAAAMKFAPLWMAPSTLADPALMNQITGGLWEGTIFSCLAELPDADIPLMKKYRAAFEKYVPKGERWGIMYMAGFGFAEPLVEALKKVGRDVTTDKVIAELDKMTDFKGIFGHITFRPEDRQGQKEVFIAEALKDGKSKRLSDWIKADR